MPSELCIKCQDVFDSWPDVLRAIKMGEDFVEYIHWENIVCLQKSADGCILCAQYLHQFSAEELDEAVRIMPDASPALKLLVLSDKHPSDLTTYDFWRLSLYLPLEEGPALAEVSVAPAEGTGPGLTLEIPSITVCQETLSLVQRWMSNCSSTHNQCITQKTFTSATRLVAFGQGSLRVAESEDFPKNLQYATLSHCWGSVQLLKLQRANLKDLRKEIPHEKLCKTFQDAIFIAKQLGFEYIWIDSLCIIQDDEDDWRRESALMSSVYGGSALNIAASSAKDGSIGCVFDRNPRPVQRLRIPLLVNGHEGLYDCADYSIYRHCVSKTPLNKRAWVLQERVLAPRTLHFSATQLFWECKTACTCETFPEILPARFYKDANGPLKKSASEQWRSLLIRYTEAQLTYSKDRLIAISGIARRISSQTGDEWVAGLWKRDLILHLCWSVGTGRYKVGHTYRFQPIAFRPPIYQAPSWSWASIESGIIHLPISGMTRAMVEILEAHITPAGDDEFGLVQGGYVRLRCGNILCGTDTSARNSWSVAFGKEEFHFIALPDEPRPRGELFHFLPVAEISDAIIGLILEPVHLRPGYFRRIGMFNVYLKDLPDFKMVMKTPGYFASQSVYADFPEIDELEENRYTITLI